MGNPKNHPKWGISGDIGFKLVKYRLRKSDFSLKVGLFFKGISLTDSAA